MVTSYSGLYEECDVEHISRTYQRIWPRLLTILRALLIAGTNFSSLVGSCIWRVLILAILMLPPSIFPSFTFMEKDATAAILRSLSGGDRFFKFLF